MQDQVDALSCELIGGAPFDPLLWNLAGLSTGKSGSKFKRERMRAFSQRSRDVTVPHSNVRNVLSPVAWCGLPCALNSKKRTKEVPDNLGARFCSGFCWRACQSIVCHYVCYLKMNLCNFEKTSDKRSES